jgi:uncharacterized protein
MRCRLAFCLLVFASSVSAQENSRAPAPVVFFDIAGEDSEKQKQFYSEVFAWDIDAGGNFSTMAITPLPALIRRDPPETVIYLGVRGIAETMQLIEAHGGSVVYPRFEVPGVVVLGMFRDPAGNRVGLVELDDTGTPIIP